jgi:hypothetical protein
MLSASIATARLLKRDLTVVWDRSCALNCPYHKLFEPIDGITLIEAAREYDDTDAMRHWYLLLEGDETTWAWVEKKRSQEFDLVLLDKETDARVRSNTDFVRLFADKHRILVIYWWQFVHAPWAMRLLVPVAPLRDRITAITDTFARTTVGVHIRRKDHAISHAVSTDDAFFSEMDARLDAGIEAFFLATDDTHTEQRLIERYGARIITQTHKRLERYAPKAIQDALVDLHCLAHTSEIIGSAESTFSLTASYLGEIPLTVARAQA